MNITPDFSEAIDLGQPVPAGKYPVRVTGHESKTSKAGAAYLSWKLQIFGAEGELATQNNRILFYSTMLSGPGAGGLKALLNATGTPLGSFDPETLYGKELLATVATKKNPDGTESQYNDIKALAPLKH